MAEEKKPIKHKVYKEPTEDEKKALYKVYEMIFDGYFSLSKKRSVMTAVLGYETWSWRVVGISEEAIKAIARNNFNKPSRMLARDHSLPRVQTYNRIFSEKMALKDWWAWIWENDKTILVTNEEHRAIKTMPISKIYPMNPAASYFVDAEVAGWHQTKGREGAFVKKLCEQHSISY